MHASRRTEASRRDGMHATRCRRRGGVRHDWQALGAGRVQAGVGTADVGAGCQRRSGGGRAAGAGESSSFKLQPTPARALSGASFFPGRAVSSMPASVDGCVALASAPPPPPTPAGQSTRRAVFASPRACLLARERSASATRRPSTPRAATLRRTAHAVHMHGMYRTPSLFPPTRTLLTCLSRSRRRLAGPSPSSSVACAHRYVRRR